VRPYVIAVLSLTLLGRTATAQSADSSRSFLNRRDLFIAGAALAGTGALSLFDDDIAQASQRGRWQDSSTRRFATRVSKVNETTLTIAGIATYGIARLAKARTVQDVALHATESVVLASLASQLIRGPLGRTRPYVTHDSDQYHFRPFKGFFGKNSFDNRAFPSIHTSSSMAVATVLTMETHRRRPGATPFVAPLLFAAGALPGLVRIPLDQHWASDIAAGAFMGVFAGYKVVSYSHAHPNNRFDRVFLNVTVAPDVEGRVRVGFSPSF
jgi:membrane-associated phospholipid phosphatase